jgi:hypothetical protein
MNARIATRLGAAEILVGISLVFYAAWQIMGVWQKSPEHVSPVWGHALGLSWAWVGLFGLGLPGAALALGHRAGWYLQVLVPLTLLAREPLTVLLVAALR